MEKYNADVVGSKRHSLSKVDYPLHRRILSDAYQLITKILFGLNLRDTQAGLKLFKHKVLKEILPRVLCKKYAFDLELLLLPYSNYHSCPPKITINLSSKLAYFSLNLVSKLIYFSFKLISNLTYIFLLQLQLVRRL